MQQTFTTAQKIRQLVGIFVPIYVSQLAGASMQVVDAMMSGQYNPVDLAGVAIGGNIWAPVMTGISGVLIAVTPIIAQHLGAGRRQEIPRVVLQGLYLSLALSLAVILAGAVALPFVLNLMDLESAVRQVAYRYLIAIAWGIFPAFAYTILRCFIDALGYTGVSMIVTLIAVPVNVVLNYAMIFGKLGFPAMGGVGAGYASALTHWLIFAIGAYITTRKSPFADYKVYRGPYKLSWRGLGGTASHRHPAGPIHRLGGRRLLRGRPFDEPLRHPRHRRSPVGHQLRHAHLHVSLERLSSAYHRRRL